MSRADPNPRAIIAEDEEVLREQLRERLSALWPELRIAAEAEDGIAALRALEADTPDVLFLDIQMPGLSGLEVAHQASGRCHVVFVTAYDKYAIAAFDEGAVDYVMKPFSPARLATTIARLKQRMGGEPAKLERLLEKLNEALKSERGHLRWITAWHRQRRASDHHRRGCLLPRRQQVHAGRHGGCGNTYPQIDQGAC